MNPVKTDKIMKSIIKFDGFKACSFKDKAKWVFVLYPFALAMSLIYRKK